MSKNTKSVRGPKPVKREAIILEMWDRGKVTSADLGVSTAFLETLRKDEITKVVGKIPTGGRGRPKNVYSLSPKGRGMGLNLVKRMKQQEMITA